MTILTGMGTDMRLSWLGTEVGVDMVWFGCTAFCPHRYRHVPATTLGQTCRYRCCYMSASKVH
eukprot:12410329-Karenia_brevis.AAC.1